MQFQLKQAVEILRRTPATLNALLRACPEAWTLNNEGAETWSPYDVVGHLIHGEQTDWLARVQMILDHGAERAFEPFDRFAQFEASRGKKLTDLLDQFQALRAKNVEILTNLALTESDLKRQGRHPELGLVTLEQLLATWVVHDLNHIGQIVQVMARQYAQGVGPWKAYLPILERPAIQEG